MNIIIAEYMPETAGLIAPHWLRRAHLFKPVICFLYIIQSRECLKHCENLFFSLQIFLRLSQQCALEEEAADLSHEFLH